MSYEKELVGILDATRYGEYAGGTLTFVPDSGEKKLVCLNVNGLGFVLEGGNETKYEQTPQERELVCKCYMKYKTPEHSLYGQAKEYLNGKPA